ncbi:MAG: ankyrin repeat domain-containing protein [Pseudomonadota bacterium]
MPVIEKHPFIPQPRIYAWFSAVIADDRALLEDLLLHGVPVDVPHPLRHSTALMEATRLGRATLVHWLLDHGAAPVFLSGLPLGTPLHCALRRHHWNIALQLAEAMDRCSAADAYGATPLHVLAAEAFAKEKTQTVRRIATAAIERACPLDALDLEGTTALHHCVINDLVELADLLLSHGANPNVLIPDSHVSALAIAALEKNTEMAHVLMLYGADPHLKTREGATPLSIYPPLGQLLTPQHAAHAELLG